MNITCIWNNKDVLGEGPLWDHRSKQLYWLDIEQQTLHELNPIEKSHRCWHLPNKPGCIGLAENNRLIMALQKEIVFFDLNSGNITHWLKPISADDDTVFNDGKVDVQGRLWVGSKHIKETEPKGALYRIDPDGQVHVMDKGFIVSNGMAWSPDHNYFYFVDGGEHRRILRYQFHLKTGAIANREIFIEIPAKAGIPDGLTVDKEGYIWLAHWDGARITRFTPDGKIDQVIKMPVPKPTSMCFGGNKSTLFITSARRDLSDEKLKEFPLSGGLFTIDVDHKGLHEPVFG